MRVLFTSEYTNTNSVSKSYIDGLTPYCEVVSGAVNFWTSSLQFDIIHLQWPEELFDWKVFNKKGLENLNIRLRYWKDGGAKIVITRHNAIPHRDFHLDHELFETCYDFADAIIHLGTFSFQEFQNSERYRDKINTIINHPNYFNLPNSITRDEARNYFKLSAKTVLFLSFGAIRFEQEQRDLIMAFKQLKIKNKQLLLTNSLYLKRIVPFWGSPLLSLKYKFDIFNLKRHGIIIDETRIISNSLIQFYYQASDVVIVPRIRQLNSGLMNLAFSFSKKVVGPDVANIGTILKETGNVLFEPGNVNSYTVAMETAAASGTGLELSNFNYAQAECDAHKIGKEHVALYETLLHNN